MEQKGRPNLMGAGTHWCPTPTPTHILGPPFCLLHEFTTYPFTLRIPYELACVNGSHLLQFPLCECFHSLRFILNYLWVCSRKIGNLLRAEAELIQFVFLAPVVMPGTGKYYGMNWPQFGRLFSFFCQYHVFVFITVHD